MGAAFAKPLSSPRYPPAAAEEAAPLALDGDRVPSGSGELCFFLWCGAYTLGLYLRGRLRLGSPLKQTPTREVLFVRCLRGMPTQGTVTNFSHIR